MSADKSIKINKSNLSQEYNPETFSVTAGSLNMFNDHRSIAQKLKNNNPYTITVIMILSILFWNNKHLFKLYRVISSKNFLRLLFLVMILAELYLKGDEEEMIRGNTLLMK